MGDGLKPVYVLLGQDAFIRREELSALVAALQGGASDGFGPSRVEGKQAELAEVLDELRTMSLLGDRRVVIVDDADPFITRYRKQLENYCEDPAPDGTLILMCQSMPSNTRLYKIIMKIGAIVRCEPPHARELGGWISNRAKQAYDKQIVAQASARLQDLVGADLATLDSELGKLAVYVNDRRQITLDDVEALVGDNREQNVFGVTDAMGAGNVAQAMRQWERVLATDKAAPGRAIGGLAWGIRRLLDCQERLEAGERLDAVARTSRMPAQILQRRLQGLSAQMLRRQLADLLEADVASKTGLATVPTAIERFIVKHSHRPRGRAGAMRR